MNIILRLVCSANDMDNIKRYHKQLKLAIDKFEIQSHINACRILTQILKKQERLSDHIQRRNDAKSIASKRNAAEAYSTEDKRHDQIKPKRRTYSINVEHMTREQEGMFSTINTSRTKARRSPSKPTPSSSTTHNQLAWAASRENHPRHSLRAHLSHL